MGAALSHLEELDGIYFEDAVDLLYKFLGLKVEEVPCFVISQSFSLISLNNPYFTIMYSPVDEDASLNGSFEKRIYVSPAKTRVGLQITVDLKKVDLKKLVYEYVKKHAGSEINSRRRPVFVSSIQVDLMEQGYRFSRQHLYEALNSLGGIQSRRDVKAFSGSSEIRIKRYFFKDSK